MAPAISTSQTFWCPCRFPYAMKRRGGCVHARTYFHVPVHCMDHGCQHVWCCHHEVAAPDSKVQAHHSSVAEQVAEVLLEYCLSDIDVTEVQDVEQLVDVPLCVLTNGSLVPFASSSSNQHCFVLTAEEQALLAGYPSATVLWQASLPKPSIPLILACAGGSA